MITTVTLNAAIDKTYYVKRFLLGEVQRVVRQIAEPGGKGNNAAKVIRLLGAEVTATGYIAGSSGTFIEERLVERGIKTSFVRIPGESRICLNIIDESTGQSTELLEQGPEIGGEHIAGMKDHLHRLAQESSIVIFSGSLPPGAPEDLYAELISVIQSASARAFLDTSGEALKRAVQARPSFVKPNEQELAQWMGKSSRLSEGEIVQAAAKLAATGIPQVCVTLGGRGAIAILNDAAFQVVPPAIQAVNTVGCGDAFTAGFAFAEEAGLPPEEKLRIAAAAAAANAMSEKAGHINDGKFQAFANQVKVISL